MTGRRGISPVPTIEVRSWDQIHDGQEYYNHLPYPYPTQTTQPPQYHPYQGHYSPYYHSAHSSSDQLNTAAAAAADGGEYLPVDHPPRPRRGFWSKLKRSKSDQDRPNTLHAHQPSYSSSHGSTSSRNSSTTDVSAPYGRTPPQAAKPDVKLVWSQEQQIWLFPRADGHDDHSLDPNLIYGYPVSSHSPSPSQCSEPDTHRRTTTTTTTKPKIATAAASLFKPRNRYDEEQLLFAQLPGHYGLNTYDYSNEQQSTPTAQAASQEAPLPYDPDYFDSMDRGSGKQSRWMNVAKNIGTPNPV